MALDEFGLTPRQRAFADYYIQSGNASDAARKAGYKAKNADVIATQNLGKVAIKQYIAMRMQPKADKRVADLDEVLAYLTGVVRGEIKDQFGLDASLQDRTKAAQELLKRYAVADMRQATTMQRLDSLFVEFRAAIAADPAPTPEAAPEPSAPEDAPATDA